MWAVRMLLIIIFIIVSIAFFIANAGERVDVNILQTRYVDVPLMIVLLIAFGIGMVASFLNCGDLFLPNFIRSVGQQAHDQASAGRNHRLA